MALRTAEAQGAPESGQIMIVVHDFSARSSDELSLSKGDRVELIERDDGFGDGWFLGRHLINGKSGLFPEGTAPDYSTALFLSNPTVYTRIAPRGSLMCSSTSLQQDLSMTKAPSLTTRTHLPHNRENLNVLASEFLTLADSPRMNNSVRQEAKVTSSNSSITILPELTAQSKSITTAVNSKSHRQDSPVMNETLSVINEHITDLKSPYGMTDGDGQLLNDSSSEYSSQADLRLSFIHGEETDEDEEEIIFTREQVSSWSPEEVSEHLFTRGVESRHCEVFRDQEITGDVLLGMDQATIFLKDFEFGSIGRRLKTWQRIKSLQEEVEFGTSKRTTLSYKADIGEFSGRNRSRSTNSSNTLPGVPSLHDRHVITLNPRLSNQSSLRNEAVQTLANSLPKKAHEICHSDGDRSKYSIGTRDAYHSRQNSSNQGSLKTFGNSLSNSIQNHPAVFQEGSHKKRGSFDRNWTMQNSAFQSYSGFPLSSLQINANDMVTSRNSIENLAKSKNNPSSTDLLENNHFPDTATDSGARSAIQTQEILNMNSIAGSRRSSYAEDKRLRDSYGQRIHSRFGSVDSIRDAPPHSAANKHYGLGNSVTRRRTPSETSISGSSRTHFSKDPSSVSLITTKPDSSPIGPLDSRPEKGDFISSMRSASNGRSGLRAISNAVTGLEKSRTMYHPPEPAVDPQQKFTPVQSPSGTSSSAPSGGLSFDLDSPGKKGVNIFPSVHNNGRARKKTKKETSAYVRGLEKKKPQEAIKSADYSGWMKKKSTNLMASWKPRLFVLRGRRLSYYYSEDDEGERGLIDISFHRVLPADNDRLTGLHATLTGATHASKNPNTESTFALSQALEPESSLDKGNDSMFIFKLVPPKAGLQRAVTFTKPTVHYFAVPNVNQGRLWMAALMKATIERDESVLLTSTYQQKTISLTKARAMRHRPPALMNLNERNENEIIKSNEHCLDKSRVTYKKDPQEGDSGVSGVSNSEPHRRESINTKCYPDVENSIEAKLQPKTA
ncbi:putative sam domain-containing protein [Golovinomyces cichoracearum]|uniref:Putative sam domain-containing protein n=1 Tax=Golovinomyces cichoracearum TaxID=62708 RepID=A0A420IY27_9PEZI|nr:putative sam domain-containing protein [Golovinomyces cichoracearum]